MRTLSSTLFLAALALAVACHGGGHGHGHHGGHDDGHHGGGHHGGGHHDGGGHHGGDHGGHGYDDIHHDGAENRQRGLITPLHAKRFSKHKNYISFFHTLIAKFHCMMLISKKTMWLASNHFSGALNDT